MLFVVRKSALFLRMTRKERLRKVGAEEQEPSRYSSLVNRRSFGIISMRNL